MNSRGAIMSRAPTRDSAMLPWRAPTNDDLSCRWWRRWGCLGLGGRFRLGRRPAALGTTADIHHRAIAALHFRIHPAQNQDASIEQDHFAVLRAAGRIFGGPDKCFAPLRALEAQLGRGRLVGKMH